MPAPVQLGYGKPATRSLASRVRALGADFWCGQPFCLTSELSPQEVIGGLRAYASTSPVRIKYAISNGDFTLCVRKSWLSRGPNVIVRGSVFTSPTGARVQAYFRDPAFGRWSLAIWMGLLVLVWLSNLAGALMHPARFLESPGVITLSITAPLALACLPLLLHLVASGLRPSREERMLKGILHQACGHPNPHGPPLGHSA
jgi:hypothetical protein